MPTDSSYALVCQLDDKAAVDRLRQVRGVDEKHHLTLLCRDLSELVELRARGQPAVPAAQAGHAGAVHLHPGGHQEVPRRVSHPQRKTIGLRVPDHQVLQELLELLGQPLLGTTLIPPRRNRAAERRRGRSASASSS